MEALTVLQPQVLLSDPHLWTDARHRLNLRFAVYESLVRPAPGSTFAPALAKNWAVASDARNWEFDLRAGVIFHNGEPLLAADVVASLDRARSPDALGELGTSGLYRDYLGGAEIGVLSDTRVRIVASEPMADLLDLLAEIPIVPRSAGTDLHTRAIGSGPYRVVDAGNEIVVMAAFSEYWGLPPKAGKLQFRAEPDEQRRVHALLAGEADVVTDLSVLGSAELAGAEDTRLIAQPSSTCVIFMCNAANGACADKRVRQALNYALDVRELIERLMGGGAEPLNGPLTPLHLGHNPATPAYSYSPARARALLADAGYPDGLQITLDVPTVTPHFAPRLAELMVEQYARAGIQGAVTVFPDRPAYSEMVKAKQIDDACCFDSSPLSTWRVLREKFHSRVAGPWWQRYSNPAVDGLLDKASTTIDRAARQATYRQAYHLIRDDAPWIFLFSPTLYWGAGPRAAEATAGVDGVLNL